MKSEVFNLFRVLAAAEVRRSTYHTKTDDGDAWLVDVVRVPLAATKKSPAHGARPLPQDGQARHHHRPRPRLGALPKKVLERTDIPEAELCHLDGGGGRGVSRIRCSVRTSGELVYQGP